MKKALLISAILLSTTYCSREDDVRKALDITVCQWWHKHSICVCVGRSVYQAWSFTAPDRVCKGEK